MAENNIIINQEVSLPYPFGVHKAFPLDSRSFFSNMSEAQLAVRDAVELKRNQNGTFTLPSEEDGGADSVYYYGEPVVVVENGADTVGLYIITKAYDNQNNPYGRLENVCSGLSNEYLRKSDANELINELIQQYVEENLNTECIDDYLFTNAIDECGNTLPTDGLYAYGFKEVNGVLEKCEEVKKVLSFDPETSYNKNTNQLATLDSVRNRIGALKDYLEDYVKRNVNNTKVVLKGENGCIIGQFTLNQASNGDIEITIPSQVTVDQAYNAVSQNAQSGTAVTGAISEKANTNDVIQRVTGHTNEIPTLTSTGTVQGSGKTMANVVFFEDVN